MFKNNQNTEIRDSPNPKNHGISGIGICKMEDLFHTYHAA